MDCFGTCGCDECWCFVFFFQAEDGIRDLVRSRGLGDVYKRQTLASKHSGLVFIAAAFGWVALIALSRQVARNNRPVSYTHLTLPTSDLV